MSEEVEAMDRAWCTKCHRDASYRKTGKGSGCHILLNALTNHSFDYWVYDEDGGRCAEFRPIKPKELRRKKPKKKVDPNQLGLF